MNSFFRELKQRKVYRVALGYAVAGWLVIQIASTVLPTFHVPARDPSPHRHKAPTAQAPDAQLSAPALHHPTPRATGRVE